MSSIVESSILESCAVGKPRPLATETIAAESRVTNRLLDAGTFVAAEDAICDKKHWARGILEAIG